MYVTIVCDFNSDNSRKIVDTILMEYGFVQCQKSVYEINSISENQVSRLKLEIDRNSDSYDHVRMYQYPLNHAMVISHLYEKRWKKKIIQDKAIMKGKQSVK
ncbi:MAG: CRISPR-associated endonuclease Cas2 [Spirochaetaceae bacterium 4572_7]|nr:MAG: CRISPR-associated endonuclease Cas2 [Spirochaetaceae bacterium 4572_7]